MTQPLNMLPMASLVVALALGCVCCDRKPKAQQHFETSQNNLLENAFTNETRPTNQADQSSVYDSGNLAEYYGRCPKCQRWVKGYWSSSTYGTPDGKVVGCRSGISGTCEHCRWELFASTAGAAETDSRIVQWTLP